MKRFLLFLVFLFLVFFSFWFFFQKTPLSTPVEKKTEIKIDEPEQGMKQIAYQEQKFLFLEQKISQPEKLILLPNFEKKISSTELFKENSCQFLANGGFYDQQDRPLGWFFSQEKLWKKEIKSTLLNGFIAQNEEGKISLDDVAPYFPVRWGLQTGPLLVFKGQPVKFKLIRDEQARRIVLALNQKDELFFLVVTRVDSLASGPLLADLPLVVEKIGKTLGEDFKTAVNLDGGTASAFLSQKKTIKEYTWIGSFFCLQRD